MSVDLDPLISIPAAARAIGLERTTLGKQVRQGLVRSHDGKVRLSEVLADRAANIDLGRSRRREGAIDTPGEVGGKAAAQRAPAGPQDTDDDGPGDEGRVVMVDGQPMPYADARALKESYNAWRGKLLFEEEKGRLAPIKGMLDQLDREYAVLRDRLLVIPGKMSGHLDFTSEQIAFVTDELYEAMESLSARGAAAEMQLRDLRGDDGGEDGGP